MRHILALSAVLILAGACLAAEFKSDEAKKAQSDYTAALEAAKTAYGQSLAKAKATIDAKAAAATDAISKEAIQSESAAIIEELVRLRDANAASFEPREWKIADAKKVAAAYTADLKAAKTKYGLDLAKARQALLARKAAATESAAKEALQAEIVLIEGEQTRLKDDGKNAKPTQAQGGFSPVGEWQKAGTKTRFTFLADGRVQAPKAIDRKYAEGTWAFSGGKLTITFKDGEKMTFEVVNADTLKSAEWQLRRQAAGK